MSRFQTVQISATRLSLVVWSMGVFGAIGGAISVIGQEKMDRAAIPRPGAARIQREEEAREARRIAREAAIAAAIAEAEGRKLDPLPEVSPDEAGEGTEPAEPADGAATAMAGAIPPELAEMLPVGAEFEGVRFPNYKGDQLTSIVNSEKMARLDSEHLDLTDLVIDLLNDVGEIETKIYMDRAVYDLTEKRLVSRSEATIEQDPKFIMTGDKLVFEGDAQKGKMTGNVKMTIFNMKAAGGGSILTGNRPAGESEESE